MQKTPGRRAWIAAACLIGAVVTSCFIALGLNDPRWGTDFWQRVIVSGLGTLGSAGIAIGLYFLKRRHDRHDEQLKAAVHEQDELKRRLAQYVREHAREMNQVRQAARIDAAVTQLSRFTIDLGDYWLSIRDKKIDAFCRAYVAYTDGAMTYLIQLVAKQVEHDPQTLLVAYTRIAGFMATDLTAYLYRGRPFDLAYLGTWIDDYSLPDPR